MAKSKKPKSVFDAEELRDAKQQELKDAEEIVKKLRDEVGAAFVAIRKEQESYDSTMAQCDMVSVNRGGRISLVGRMVILRKTPTGMLIVRRFGDTNCEFKFKYLSGKFTSADKQYRYMSSTNELRNVPDEFVPKVGDLI